MSYTTGTTHYNLPQTVGTDKRDWSDTNQAFQDVDAALYEAVQDVAQASSDVDALEARMDTSEQNISTNTGNIAGLDTRVTTVEGAVSSLSGQVTDTRQDLEDMICAYNEASATSTHAYAIGDYFIYNDVLYKATQIIAIGDTIVPDTNCVTTNVATELLTTEDLSDDVTQLQTDVGTLQTDVGSLQTALGKVGYVKLGSVTSNGTSPRSTLLHTLLSAHITTSNDLDREYMLVQHLVTGSGGIVFFRESYSQYSSTANNRKIEFQSMGRYVNNEAQYVLQNILHNVGTSGTSWKNMILTTTGNSDNDESSTPLAAGTIFDLYVGNVRFN